MNKSHWSFLGSLAMVLLSACLIFGTLPTMNAYAINYGGRAFLGIPCTCDDPPESTWIFLGAPSSMMEVLYVPFETDLRMFYMPEMPAWQLGYTTGVGDCSLYVGETCVDLTGVPTMSLNGTSEI